MAGELLASYYVQFGQKGLDLLKTEIGGLEKTVRATAAASESALTRLGKSITEVARAGERAFGGLAQSILSWVRAGLQGTTTGNLLGLQMQMLSRQIASLVIGPINALIGAIARVTTWFRSLDGDQQRLIGRFMTAVVVITAVSAAIPKLTGGLAGLSMLLKVLSANPIIALAAAIVGIVASTEEGRSALGGLLSALAPIGAALAGLGQAFQPVIDALARVIPPLIQALAPLFRAVATVVATIVEMLTPLVRLLGEVLPPLIEALAPAFQVVANVIETIVGWVKQVIGWVRQLLEWVGLVEPARAQAAGERTPRRPGAQRQELQMAGGGFEDITSAFRRFQTALNQSSIPQQQLDVQRRIEENTRPRDQRPGGIAERANPPAATPALPPAPAIIT